MGTKETEMKKFKLSDSSIVQIVRLIQMGMLTGTDVTDQLRTFEVCENSSGVRGVSWLCWLLRVCCV